MLTIDQIREYLRQEPTLTFDPEDWLRGGGEAPDLDGYKFEHIMQVGGEGQGDDYYCIFKVSNDAEQALFKVPGWYSSGNDSELEVDSLFEVEAEEKTFTVYEKKNEHVK